MTRMCKFVATCVAFSLTTLPSVVVGVAADEQVENGEQFRADTATVMIDSTGWLDSLGSFVLDLEYRQNRDAAMDSQSHEAWVLTRAVIQDSPMRYYSVRVNSLWRVNPVEDVLEDWSGVKLFRGTGTKSEGLEPAFEADWTRRFCPPGAAGCASIIFPEDFRIISMLFDTPLGPQSMRMEAEAIITPCLTTQNYPFLEVEILKKKPSSKDEGILKISNPEPTQKCTVKWLRDARVSAPEGRQYTSTVGLMLQWLEYDNGEKRVTLCRRYRVPPMHRKTDDWDRVGHLDRDVQTTWTWFQGKTQPVLVPKTVRRQLWIKPPRGKEPADVYRSTLKLNWKPLPKEPPEFQDDFDYEADYKAMLKTAEEKIGR